MYIIKMETNMTKVVRFNDVIDIYVYDEPNVWSSMKNFMLSIMMMLKPPRGVLDISLGGEVRRGPSYPDPF